MKPSKEEEELTRMTMRMSMHKSDKKDKGAKNKDKGKDKKDKIVKKKQVKWIELKEIFMY